MKATIINKVNIFWFRRDLRLEDNTALFHALKAGNVLPIFIFDPQILGKLKDKSDKRVQFIYESLINIKEELNKIDGDLLILFSSPKEAFEKLTTDFNISTVFTNEDYEPYALKRDSMVKKFLSNKKIDFIQKKDQVIWAKDEVLKKDGLPYTVYTPYKNKWLLQFHEVGLKKYDSKKYLNNILKIKKSRPPSLNSLGFKRDPTFKIEKKISKNTLINYANRRDLIYLENATSRLGIHLRFGTISVRKCVKLGLDYSQCFLEELIWREFFMQILYNFPHVINAPFRKKYSKLKWLNNKNNYKKWCEGKTGFPLVDAGIRELNETGHMHNRVRMLVASFLVKDLLIDWQWGEKYFASKLLDFDLSSNNGNWQWAAGTGCDAAPYFRIFNPDTQQKKFDPDKAYIKRWIKEYGTDAYPEKMIDHSYAYKRALEFYKQGIIHEK